MGTRGRRSAAAARIAALEAALAGAEQRAAGLAALEAAARAWTADNPDMRAYERFFAAVAALDPAPDPAGGAPLPRAGGVA